MPNEFLAGMSDKKIVQFDVRVAGAKPVQEYDHHLGPVNTITFCDEDRRFITTSDDKSLRAWGEFAWRLGTRLELGLLMSVHRILHSSADQVHRRAIHVLHGSRSAASQRQVRGLPERRQPDCRLLLRQQVQAKSKGEKSHIHRISTQES